jgi:Protein kinase domain/WD40-like Beta Propeller Repeat
MTFERWRQIEDLCHASLARPAEERTAFLAEACTGDDVLKREVESLLAEESRANGFMSAPATPVAVSAMLDHAKGTLVGRRLGPYAIRSLLGVGGMGEVYRAHDDTLRREVAIKVLPPAFTADPERRARLEREARMLATLNHPHIGAIYGVEDTDGLRALVLELVEGETLAERLAPAVSPAARSGALPLPDALAIARQIADALDAAHEKGIVHRDLKPANIKITPDGVVKVLDFGLAKAASPNGSHSDLPESRVGVILGTAAYMSPEQARGHSVDKRGDIWAFGCVLYEMLSGRLAFPGDTVSDTIAKILEREPDWSALPAATPAPIRRLLLRCLTKDPKQRLRDIGDVRIEIEAIDEVLPGASEGAVASTAPAKPHTVWLLVAGALAFGLALLLMVWAPWRKTLTAPTALRVSAELGADVPLASINVQFGDATAISPDGAVIAFVAQKGTGQQIYVRRLNQLRAAPLFGTDGAVIPFFSPDGLWIGFFANGKLKKIAVTGGSVVTLADAPDQRGGTWSGDDTIVFSPTKLAGTRLLRMSASGGKAEPLTSLAEGEITQVWPQILPGNKGVLYTSSSIPSAYNDANLMVQPLPGGTRKIVQRGGYHGRYLPSGHLVYIHDGTLFAAPFDLDRLEVTGQPVVALESVRSNSITGGAQFSVSDGGTLVYLPGQSKGGGIPLQWMDHAGKTTPLRTTLANWFNPRFAPDGGRLAMEIREGPSDVWVYELARDTLTRLTADPAEDATPVWTPDGNGIVFASARADKSTLNLYVQRADGIGEAQRLTESTNVQQPGSWHPSGKFLAFEETTPQTKIDIMILPVEGDSASGWKPGKPRVFLNGPHVEAEPMFSPDGQWLAYSAGESGHPEVYVRPFPGPGGPWQISPGGGLNPTWSRTKRELFYGFFDGRIMAVDYSVAGEAFHAGMPRPWSEGRYQPRGPDRMFDLHPDGERFALAPDAQMPAAAKQDKVVFIFNFFDELRRIAPATRQ